MQRILLLLVVLILVLTVVILTRDSKEAYKVLPATLPPTVTVKPFEDWREYTSPKANFKVVLPLIPQHATESVPDTVNKGSRKYDMYVAEKANGSIFMISLITYSQPQDSEMNEINLDKVIQEMVDSNANNVLKGETKLQFQKASARDFSIENNDVKIDNREFMIKNTLFLLTYISKKENYNKDEFDHFVNSFELLPEAAK